MTLTARAQSNEFKPSQQVTDEIETAAELVADFGLDDEGDELLNVISAAQEIGCSLATLNNYISDESLPSEKHGRRRYVRKSVCEIVRELREAHGYHWKQFATWQPAPDAEDGVPWAEGDEPKETVDAVASNDPVFHPFEILNAAKRAKKDGRSEAAAELYDLLCSKFTFEAAT